MPTNAAMIAANNACRIDFQSGATSRNFFQFLKVCWPSANSAMTCPFGKTMNGTPRCSWLSPSARDCEALQLGAVAARAHMIS
ncbi:hypothetical protein SAMN05443247_04886 [Bradyrhizobium erythrophlei]|jgi:hypothetical protein|nr:hypothetical protein SAMN05443247_04886 [Bradyrhizobium erythrophlei]